MKRVLVVAPHPDDEAFGCGGAILGHADAGDRVEVVFLTSGERGGHGRDPGETARLREEEARRAGEVLGVSGIEFWREPDGRLRATAALADRLAAAVEERGIDRVYVPHAADDHPDHRAAARLVRRAMDDPPRPVEVLGYEVWTPVPRIDAIVDITEWIEAKVAALREHRTQCEALRFDESARGLSRYRGEMHSWPGGPYAEVFARWTASPTAPR